jgi:subtilisin family serine protease
MRRNILVVSSFLMSTMISLHSYGAKPTEFLVKLTPSAEKSNKFVTRLGEAGAKVKNLTFGPWLHVSLPENSEKLNQLLSSPEVEYIQPNYKVKLLNNYQLTDPVLRAKAKALWAQKVGPFASKAAPQDNPDIPTEGTGQDGQGADPDFSKQWGMQNGGVKEAWKHTMGTPEIVVAVIDTGVDYTHEDLVGNLWHNKKEIPGNNIDDDENGFKDDIIGWDFVSNDNKPFDLSMDLMDILMGGGNPGHGTHCAGNVAARADNGKGIAGVAPGVSIMPIRFLSEKGEGTTAGAIQSIQYAVDNGAKILSNSWGSEGEDEGEAENRALREIIQYAEGKGTLFIAAAGNGHNGVGYDNDSDARPGIPASYDMNTIVSVAALDVNNSLGAFSNWGKRTVDIGAPGVKVFSTVPGNK